MAVEELKKHLSWDTEILTRIPSAQPSAMLVSSISLPARIMSRAVPEM